MTTNHIILSRWRR